METGSKMKTNTQIKYEDAIANAEAYIEQMKAMDDQKLSKHLDLFRHQMEKLTKQTTMLPMNCWANMKNS